jgi:hypothetical protein
VGNLAALMWTLLCSPKSPDGIGENVLHFNLLQRIHDAIDTDPVRALRVRLFALNRDDAEGTGDTGALADRIRQRVKRGMDKAGVDSSLKAGVLRLLRPTGVARASGGNAPLELVQMMAGWASHSSTVLLMVCSCPVLLSVSWKCACVVGKW